MKNYMTFGEFVQRLQENDEVNEISDAKKRRYLDAAIDDHGKRWGEKAGPEHLTPKGRLKKSWVDSPERKKRTAKLDDRRDWIQKTAKDVTGRKHFSDMDGEPYNARDGKKYSTEETVNELSTEKLKKYVAKVKDEGNDK